LIPINISILDEKEKLEVMKVMDSGFLTTAASEGGAYVKKMQSSLESFLNVKHVLAVNSGTAALYASLLAIGVKPGDEVLIPSFTFLATANSVLLTGAKPVFVDIELNHYNMNPADLAKKITEKTKAVMPVHLYGHPAEMSEITEIAAKHGLNIIEDAAQSLGSTYKGLQTGTLSDIGCFSLYASKIITSGEGGFIATNRTELAEKVKMIRNHGMISPYNSGTLGSNMRMPEIEAAIAYVQMSKLPTFLKSRRENAGYLSKALSTFSGVNLPTEAERCKSNWYLYTVLINKNRDVVQRYLQSKGIGAAVYYNPPVHKSDIYKGNRFGDTSLDNTDFASNHVLSLPVHPKVTKDDLTLISTTLHEVLTLNQ